MTIDEYYDSLVKSLRIHVEDDNGYEYNRCKDCILYEKSKVFKGFCTPACTDELVLLAAEAIEALMNVEKERKKR